MSKTLTDLNNHLFDQMERLSRTNLTTVDNAGELEAELARTRAMTHVGNTIIANGRLVLDAHVCLRDDDNVPELLGSDGD